VEGRKYLQRCPSQHCASASQHFPVFSKAELWKETQTQICKGVYLCRYKVEAEAQCRSVFSKVFVFPQRLLKETQTLGIADLCFSFFPLPSFHYVETWKRGNVEVEKKKNIGNRGNVKNSSSLFFPM
jgi:hypothetical protein